jgi:hypothetical protein
MEVTNPWFEPKFAPHIPSHKPTLTNYPKKIPPTISANIIHTCHVGFHVVFSYTITVMGCSPKLPSCKPNLKREGPMTLSTNENPRILKSHGLIVFSCKQALKSHIYPTTRTHIIHTCHVGSHLLPPFQNNCPNPPPKVLYIKMFAEQTFYDTKV